MNFPALLRTVLVGMTCCALKASQVAGRVADSSSINAVAAARVTLFTPDLRFFHEARSSVDGTFVFSAVGFGTYRLGVAAIGYEYQESSVTVTGLTGTVDFALQPETNGGRWTIVGNTEPELLDGSGSGNLLPSGEIFFCHDTEEPIMFDPVSGMKWYPPDSLSAQGCHIVTLNTDGGMFLTGGSMGGNPLDPVVKIAKTYWRNTNAWVRNADMNTGRWYPGLVRLPDERLLVLGGELNDPGYGRTNGCEIYDPRSNSWTNTGSFNLPTEIPPALLLYTGEVLKTWRYPELYNITTGTWRPAANMIQPRTGAAGGDHADHEIVPLPDGRVMAVGIFPMVTNASTRFCEFYDPSNNTWTLGPNPRALRNRPEALILPDGRVLSFGGQYSGPTPAPVPMANAGTIPNCTKVCDLYDPGSNTWRPMADLNRFIHYHNVTVLVPDGRVIATGGAGLTSNRSFAGDDSSIEAFEPPYLFRGVRARIDWLSTSDFVLGSNITLRVSLTERITKLVLVSARTVTHWVDGGPQRYLALDFKQDGPEVEATIPNDPVRFLAGWYLLFAIVDDIPSIGKMVRITPTPAPPLRVPSVSITSIDSTASEPGFDTAGFTVTRTGVTNAPLLVSYTIGGTAVNGVDYDAISNFVVIPAGAFSATVTLTPRDDALADGTETISISLTNTPYYNAGPATNLSVTLSDNEAAPPPLSLQLVNPTNGLIDLTLSGAATRLFTIETSSNFRTWQPFTRMLTISNASEFLDRMLTNAPYLFFRARQQE
jgi:hypothetical protein